MINAQPGNSNFIAFKYFPGALCRAKISQVVNIVSLQFSAGSLQLKVYSFFEKLTVLLDNCQLQTCNCQLTHRPSLPDVRTTATHQAYVYKVNNI